MDGMSDALKTLATRLYIPDHRRRDPGISELPGIYMLDVPVDRPRVHKGVMVYNRDAVVHVLVHVGHIRDFVNRVIVVDVSDLHHAHACVSYVYVLNIPRTSAIPRNVNLAWTEREPSDWL